MPHELERLVKVELAVEIEDLKRGVMLFPEAEPADALQPRPLATTSTASIIHAGGIRRCVIEHRCNTKPRWPQRSETLSTKSGQVQTRLDDIERRINKLTALKAELERMIQVCDGGRVDRCRIVEALDNQRR